MKKLFLALLLLVGFVVFSPVNATELSELNTASTENVILAAEQDVIIYYEVTIIDYYDMDGNYLGTEIIEILIIIIFE